MAESARGEMHSIGRQIGGELEEGLTHFFFLINFAYEQDISKKYFSY